MLHSHGNRKQQRGHLLAGIGKKTPQQPDGTAGWQNEVHLTIKLLNQIILFILSYINIPVLYVAVKRSFLLI